MEKWCKNILTQITHWPHPPTCTSSYISHSWLLTNIIQGNNSRCNVVHECRYKTLKFKILGKKMSCMSFCLIFMKRDITLVLFWSWIASANIILNKSSVNKKLMFCYILSTILFVYAQFCQIKYYLLYYSLSCHLKPVWFSFSYFS